MELDKRDHRRRYGGITDEELFGLSRRITALLIKDEDFTNQLAEQWERRIFEWIGRRVLVGFMLLGGALATGAAVFWHWVKAQVGI